MPFSITLKGSTDAEKYQHYGEMEEDLHTKHPLASIIPFRGKTPSVAICELHGKEAVHFKLLHG